MGTLQDVKKSKCRDVREECLKILCDLYAMGANRHCKMNGFSHWDYVLSEHRSIFENRKVALSRIFQREFELLDDVCWQLVSFLPFISRKMIAVDAPKGMMLSTV